MIKTVDAALLLFLQRKGELWKWSKLGGNVVCFKKLMKAERLICLFNFVNLKLQTQYATYFKSMLQILQYYLPHINNPVQ